MEYGAIPILNLYLTWDDDPIAQDTCKEGVKSKNKWWRGLMAKVTKNITQATSKTWIGTGVGEVFRESGMDPLDSIR